MKRPSGTKQERPCAGSARTARAGSIAPACSRFCPGDRARRGASCSLPCPPARARCATPVRPARESAVGRSVPAAPTAQAAAGLHAAEPVCLACAFLNPAGLQKRHAIAGIRRPSFSCPRACATWASTSRAAQGSAASLPRQCARTPVVRANLLYTQNHRRSTSRILYHMPSLDPNIASYSRSAIIPAPAVLRFPARCGHAAPRRATDPGGSFSIGGVLQDEIADLRAAAEAKIGTRAQQNRRGPVKTAADAATNRPNCRPQKRRPLPDFCRAALGD